MFHGVFEEALRKLQPLSPWAEYDTQVKPTQRKWGNNIVIGWVWAARLASTTQEVDRVRGQWLGVVTEAVKMVEQFVGSWKMVSSENFDEFLKEMGEMKCFCEL